MSDKSKVTMEVPDGMEVTMMMGSDGPVLVFYTGRFATEYSVDEVAELRDALTAWLEDKGTWNRPLTPTDVAEDVRRVEEGLSTTPRINPRRDVWLPALYRLRDAALGKRVQSTGSER